MTSQAAYPLFWPKSWPRVKPDGRASARFFTIRRQLSAPDGVYRDIRGKRGTAVSADEIMRQVMALGGVQLVVSTNVELRIDGLPYSGRRSPTDPGAAVYFSLRGRPVVLACDKWDRVEDNLWAIAKHLEALRGQERWGVGSVEQRFAGYTALPAPGESTASVWYRVLGVPHDASFEDTRAAYLSKAKQLHPDNPENVREDRSAIQTLNEAWDMAKKAFGK